MDVLSDRGVILGAVPYRACGRPQAGQNLFRDGELVSQALGLLPEIIFQRIEGFFVEDLDRDKPPDRSFGQVIKDYVEVIL
ncbi:MAG: hypothetical protein KIT43_12700 [Bauldia sp.]|nr:hypothetical protein [Bauldia sp.]